MTAYPGYGEELLAGRIRASLDSEPWEESEDDNEVEVRRIFLGTIFALTPSGKFYSPFACSNVAGCDSCGGTGSVLTVKRRTRTKWVNARVRERRLFEKRQWSGQIRAIAWRNYAKTTRSCTACGGLGSREAHQDEVWREYADALCESIGAHLENGEGDSCDLFVVECRDKEVSDEPAQSRDGDGMHRGPESEEDSMKHVLVYDNGGKTFDRFTAVYMDRPSYHGGAYEARGMSRHPTHPQGYGMYGDAMPGRHLGKRIRFQDLPEECQRLVRSDREGVEG